MLVVNNPKSKGFFFILSLTEYEVLNKERKYRNSVIEEKTYDNAGGLWDAFLLDAICCFKEHSFKHQTKISPGKIADVSGKQHPQELKLSNPVMHVLRNSHCWQNLFVSSIWFVDIIIRPVLSSIFLWAYPREWIIHTSH